MKLLFRITFTFGVLLLLSCKGGGQGNINETSLDTIPLRYAENLTLLQGEGYIVAELRNPWDTTKLLHRYILIPKSGTMPANIPNGTIVRTPLQNCMTFTSIHTKLAIELGAIESIGGVCEIEYMNIPEIHKRLENGKIIDAGKGTNPDVEKIIELSPDAILLSPFENGGGHGRMDKLGIPIIECADYMEISALGGAEWIYFYGALLGCEQVADSIFKSVEKSYNSLKQLIPENAKRPKVMYGLKTGSAWYVPAGGSGICKLLTDAGADYIFNYTAGSGSIPMAFEEVFEKGKESDVWLIRYFQQGDKSYSQLAEEYLPYKQFNPFKKRTIYGCNTSYSTYYEDFPFHPDMVLKDIISLLYPELDVNYKQKYYTKLAE